MTTEQIVYSENTGSPQTEIGKLVSIASGMESHSSGGVAKRKTHFYEKTEFISSVEDNFSILESMILLPIDIAFSEDFIQRGWTKISKKEELLDFITSYKNIESGEFIIRKHSNSVFNPLWNAEIRSNHVMLETSSGAKPNAIGIFQADRFLSYFNLQSLSFPSSDICYKYKISKDIFGKRRLIFDTISKTEVQENGRLEKMSIKSFVDFISNPKKKNREDAVTYFTGSLKRDVMISRFSENMSNFVEEPRGFAFLLGRIILKVVMKDNDMINIFEKNPEYQNDIFNFLLDLRAKKSEEYNGESVAFDSVRFIVKFMKTIQDRPLRTVSKEESNLLLKNIQKVFRLNSDVNSDYLSFFTDAYSCKIPTPSKIANDFKIPKIYEPNKSTDEEVVLVEDFHFKFQDPRIRDIGEGLFRFQCQGFEVFRQKTKGSVLIEDKKIFSSDGFKMIEADFKKQDVSMSGNLANADFTEKSLASTGAMYHKLETTDDGRKLVSSKENQNSISIDITSFLVKASEYHTIFLKAKKAIEEGGKIKTDIELLKEQFPEIKI